VGSIIDRFYLRRKAQQHALNAVEGTKKAAAGHEIPPLPLQLEKRELDHAGYQPRAP